MARKNDGIISSSMKARQVRQRSESKNMSGRTLASSDRTRADPTTLGAVPVCANCREVLRQGARFCTRCGTPVELGRQVSDSAPKPLKIQKPSIGATSKRPGRSGFLGFLVLSLVALLIASGCVLWYWTDTGRLPWETSSTSIPDSVTLHVLKETLPPSEPAVGLPEVVVTPTPFQTGATGASIQKAWVETNAIDENGDVGLRVHALAHAGGSGVRFAAHFRDAYSAPLYAGDPHFRDANGEASAVVPVPVSGEIAGVEVFVPYTAISLRAESSHFQLMPGLFDASNRVIVKGSPVPFTLLRGIGYITRIQLNAQPQVNSNGELFRTAKVSFRLLYSGGAHGIVVILFKDGHGLPLHGRPPFANAAGELEASAKFDVASTSGRAAFSDIPVTFLSRLVKPGTVAEIKLFDTASGKWLSEPVEFVIH